VELPIRAPMELCLYFNEGAMLIPLAACGRFSPSRFGDEGEPVFPSRGCRRTTHGHGDSNSRGERGRSAAPLRGWRINSHFTCVFANFKGNRRALQRPIVLISSRAQRDGERDRGGRGEEWINGKLIFVKGSCALKTPLSDTEFVLAA